VSLKNQHTVTLRSKYSSEKINESSKKLFIYLPGQKKYIFGIEKKQGRYDESVPVLIRKKKIA
jgi:hypothetical protein